MATTEQGHRTLVALASVRHGGRDPLARDGSDFSVATVAVSRERPGWQLPHLPATPATGRKVASMERRTS